MTPTLTADPAPDARMDTAPIPPPQRLLHVGCGAAHPDKVPAAFFPRGAWQEIRLDIDPSVAPDILASITDMAVVPDASVDAVWSAHNLEHLRAHEVPRALAEFLRVLRPGGFLLVTMPDLQQVAALVAEGRLEDPAYVSALGPIAALDMLYGFRPAIASGNDFMAHRTGFTAQSLTDHLTRAGFAEIRVQRDGGFALWASAQRPG
ncbi:class I SAM-dependent methyltransferase [Xinfangfangia pollutisoli]|uniref:class I SAM-dependent methyltransferase n=1 Tax=Xinfangfangia pollutisoli TaxID=2865960 RepID=UPI001CD5FA7C|nr:class I SAM-dependent methyltransferase [Xinfangfangia pollutisoli]